MIPHFQKCANCNILGRPTNNTLIYKHKHNQLISIMTSILPRPAQVSGSKTNYAIFMHVFLSGKRHVVSHNARQTCH